MLFAASAKKMVTHLRNSAGIVKGVVVVLGALWDAERHKAHSFEAMDHCAT